MDGLTLAASVAELQCLIGGRIEKIQQPEKYELLLSVHTPGGSKKLLLSSSSENCRIHLTDEKRVSPIDAPNFLMLLRKHLTGARIRAIEQPNLDRIVLLQLDAFTELHDSASFTLACEIMGRYSNIILVDAEGVVLDAIRRVSPGMSSVRLVLPRVNYELPAVQEKLDPRQASPEQLEEKLIDSERPDKALSALLYGLSPTVAGFLIEYAESRLRFAFGEEYASVCSDKTRMASELSAEILSFYDDLLSCREKACILQRGSKRILLPFTPEPVLDDRIESFDSVSAAAEEFYRLRAQDESVKRRTASIDKVLTNAIQRLERKLDRFSLSIGDEDEIERLKLCGELLTAYMYAVPSGSREATVENYYLDPPAPVSIPLDPTRSAAENAQQYYKKYRKAKSARDIATVKYKETKDELEYLKGVYSDLSGCVTDSDFDEIRNELMLGGYIHVRSNAAKQFKLPPAKPLHFISSDGTDIYVGKNNTQNDRLTFKTAAADDIWLHTKDIHGSHVIIKALRKEIGDKTLLEAAELAAYYSQARSSSAVPVDYTRRKFVHKPSGAKPGMAIYTNNRTLYVTPSERTPEKLKKGK